MAVAATTLAMQPRELDKAALFADLGYKPHEGQRAIHQSQARFRVVACGVRWGKTLAAAMEGVAAAMAPAERSVGWVVAPTYDLADRVFREIEVVVLEHLRHRLIAKKEAERRIIIRNLSGGTSEIRAKSADNPVSLLGEGLNWLVVDEASRLKPVIWQAHLSQRLVDKQGWALLLSTPKGKGYYFDLFRRGRGERKDPDYESWNMPSWTNPLLDRAVIEQERERLPERTFRQEYGAEFIEGTGAVFRDVRPCATGEWREPERDESYYAGLDLARLSDYTVLVIVDENARVVFADRHRRLDWGAQLARVVGAVRRYNDAQILCDSTGVGDPVLGLLKNEGCNVEGYSLTAASKSALIQSLSMMLEQRQIVLPRPELWPEGIDELEAFEYSVTEHDHVRMSAPGGQHDDCVVALALAAWHVRPSRVKHITVTHELRF